jgi:hypothetical protein
LVSRYAVPEIFDKFDALIHGQLLQLRLHDLVPFFSGPLGYAAAVRVPAFTCKYVIYDI